MSKYMSYKGKLTPTGKSLKEYVDSVSPTTIENYLDFYIKYLDYEALFMVDELYTIEFKLDEDVGFEHFECTENKDGTIDFNISFDARHHSFRQSLSDALDNDRTINFDKTHQNIGDSNYSEHQGMMPWDIWLEYDLDPWDADIIKRVLRKKKSQCRIEEYKKIIQVCNEKIRQLEVKNES